MRSVIVIDDNIGGVIKIDYVAASFDNDGVISRNSRITGDVDGVFCNSRSKICGAGLRGSENVIRALLEIIDGVAVIVSRVVEVDNVARSRDGDGAVFRDRSETFYRY
jgi:hypothetical protein